MNPGQNFTYKLLEIESVPMFTVHLAYRRRYKKVLLLSCFYGKRQKQAWHNLCKKWQDKVANNYWSSTTYVNNTTNAWTVNFNNGNGNNNNKTNSYYVRCVSSGA